MTERVSDAEVAAMIERLSEVYAQQYKEEQSPDVIYQYERDRTDAAALLARLQKEREERDAIPKFLTPASFRGAP